MSVRGRLWKCESPKEETFVQWSCAPLTSPQVASASTPFHPPLPAGTYNRKQRAIGLHKMKLQCGSLVRSTVLSKEHWPYKQGFNPVQRASVTVTLITVTIAYIESFLSQKGPSHTENNLILRQLAKNSDAFANLHQFYCNRSSLYAYSDLDHTIFDFTFVDLTSGLHFTLWLLRCGISLV